MVPTAILKDLASGAGPYGVGSVAAGIGGPQVTDSKFMTNPTSELHTRGPFLRLLSNQIEAQKEHANT